MYFSASHNKNKYLHMHMRVVKLCHPSDCAVSCGAVAYIGRLEKSSDWQWPVEYE